MRKSLYVLILGNAFLLAVTFSTNAQTTNRSSMMEAIQQRAEMMESSVLKNYPVRSIGPVVQGARIVDIAVAPDDFNTYYISYASGGVFKTTNNGVSFKPVFDHQGALTIGDMAVAPSDPSILYVGTGEKNSSRSTYAGSGIYVSKDAGNTWTHIGLDNSHHISRVIVHPKDPNTLWVASIGALYSKNKERGVYKSIDGGQTWNQTLFVNDSTGIIDLAINEHDPKILVASSWERSRSASNFKEGGMGSAIYRSEDGGNSWLKSMTGFPDSPDNGRIGLNFAQGSPNIVYAVHDNQHKTKEEKKKEGDELVIKDFISMDKATFKSLDDKKLNEFLKKNNFPDKYNAAKVKEEIAAGKYEPKAIAAYFGDANAALFDTKVTGAEVYRSEDGGKSWSKMNEYMLEGVFFTYGYYFAEITVSPSNTDEIYIYGVPLLKSLDGGKTFTRIDTIGNVHVDHHSMWVNPKNDDHVLLGNDGGLYVSYDGGAEWLHLNNDAVGQFYTVNVDMEKPYNVYGGLQDNGTLTGSSRSVPGRTQHWDYVFGGDGMFVAPDPRNNDIVYAGFQFGNYFRIDRDQGKRTFISPKHDLGEVPLRFNWRTPLILSKHNADILYIGAQKVYRSVNQGESWDAISDDLTKNLPQGDVPFSTISAIAESPHKFGCIYVGTDDGNVHLTQNGGGTWTSLNEGLPAGLWVSSIFVSPHQEATVFVGLTGYRHDDFTTYVYKSTDYGSNWMSIAGNLPNEPVNVIIQDPVNAGLLYVGTDHGTYVSFDAGSHWEHLSEIPNVASYDMLVHPRDNELVVATHGRSIYVVDVKPFQKLKGDKLKAPIVAFKADDIRHSDRWGKKRYEYLETYLPSQKIRYHVGEATEQLTIEIQDEKGIVLRTLKAPGNTGFHKVEWDVRVLKDPGSKRKSKSTPELIFAGKGKYKISMIHPNGKDQVEFEIK